MRNKERDEYRRSKKHERETNRVHHEDTDAFTGHEEHLRDRIT
jgi:hypothetical protein